MLNWLYSGIERCVRRNSARQAKMLERIPAWLVRKTSEAKLVRTLRYVYRNSPAQRSRWHQAGLKLRDIRSGEALQHIPFTTGGELAAQVQDYICVPPEELIHVLTTSATKGLQKKIYLTDDDLKHQVRTMASMLRRFPGAHRAAAMFQVQDPTWTVGAVLRSAIAEAGMLGFLAGLQRTISQQIDLIKEYDIDYLITAPAYLCRLTYEAPEDVKKLGVKYIQLGTQPWTEEYRGRMQKAWGAKLIDGYGSNECVCGIAAECVHQSGLHVAEVDFWLEIIDPATADVLPEGEEGEVVVTTLSRRGMPLVRYRTGDLSRLLPNEQSCQCGNPLRKMDRIRGRVDDMLIVGAGYNLYPDEVDQAVLSVPGITDYQLVVDKNRHKDIMYLTVETAKPQKDLADILKKMLLGVENIALAAGVSGTLTFGKFQVVAPGSLSNGRSKSVRIIDRRTGQLIKKPMAPATSGL